MFETVAATAAEKRERRPGDELVPAADVVMDRGFTVAGRPEWVWPWIAQLGKWRAGWCLPRRVERFRPPSRRGTREIVRHWQQLGPGDVVPGRIWLAETAAELLDLRTIAGPAAGPRERLAPPS